MVANPYSGRCHSWMLFFRRWKPMKFHDNVIRFLGLNARFMDFKRPDEMILLVVVV